jgi:uncharacterized damage-inducible protein DinB
MENNTLQAATATGKTFTSPEQLLAHWQGHRNLTRKVIQAFPEDKLFSFSVGGMRPFSELAREMLMMAAPSIKGLLERHYPSFEEAQKQFEDISGKEELLRRWDAATEELNKYWGKLPAERFQEDELFWGQWGGPVYSNIFYLIDNEIHHRGQGYVYLRALGIEPPPFWERQ